MSLVNQSKKTYNSSVAILTSLTFITGIATIFLGFVFVPFAAAFYAMLLFCEKYGRHRIFSYVAPVALIALDVLYNGYAILGSVSFLLVGFLLFFMYSTGAGKFETVIIISAVLYAFYLAAVFSLILQYVDKASLESIKNSLLYAYDSGKNILLSMYDESVKILAENGIAPNYTSAIIIDTYNFYLLRIPAYMFVCAIISVAIASKIFRFFIVKYTKDAPGAIRWRIHTPSAFAILYIIASILRLFISDGVFGLCVIWIYITLSIIYAYIGIKFIYQFISLKKSSILAVVVIAIAFIMFSGLSYSIASYFGAYYVISVNRRANAERKG